MNQTRSRPLTPSERKKIDKYELYERSVQTPDEHAKCFKELYEEIHGKAPQILREDFCGTYLISQEWVKLSPDHIAYGLDLDPETLEYAKKHHLGSLTTDQRKRVKAYKKNVINVTTPKADLCVACNFSFFIFKEKKTLVEYFKKVYQSLKPDSAFFLEMAGGPGMYEKTKERRRYQKNKKHWYTYIWDQKRFDPITHHGEYAIHFQFPNGKIWENAFSYDWRMWTMPEVLEALQLAGFEETAIYWDETDSDDPDLGIYHKREVGENDDAWIVLATGIKRSKKKRPLKGSQGNGSHYSRSTRGSRSSKSH